MGLLDLAAGALDFGSNLFKTGYNLFTNQRDFEYQRDLQQKIFEREDNAVQRRKADLEAAGFNPALAMGQSAGAGTPVARSTTNDLNIGSVLDTVNAMNQIKLQKQQLQGQKLQNEILAMDEDIKSYDSLIKKWEFARKQAQILTDLGIPHMSFMSVDDATGFASPYIYPNTELKLYDTKIEQGKNYEIMEQVKKLEELGLNIDAQTLQNEISQIDLDFATAGKVANFLGLIIKALK